MTDLRGALHDGSVYRALVLCALLLTGCVEASFVDAGSGVDAAPRDAGGSTDADPEEDTGPPPLDDASGSFDSAEALASRVSSSSVPSSVAAAAASAVLAAAAARALS